MIHYKCVVINDQNSVVATCMHSLTLKSSSLYTETINHKLIDMKYYAHKSLLQHT